MRSLKNEDGVSEIVGVLLILLIGVVYLGVLQTYEVPDWNKELEMQHFEIAKNDFISFRSNTEDVAIKDISRTSKLRMGTRYPDRFILRNPGPGAYGSISTYPLNINFSYINEAGDIVQRNYTSMGIVYELDSTAQLPKLVLENGLIIEDYGTANFSIDEEQKMITINNVFIPVIGGRVNSLASMSVETFTIIPIGKGNYEQQTFSSMNITVETRYPGIWNSFSNNINLPSGSNFSVVGNTIKISKIPGYGAKPLKRPQPLSLPNATDMSNELYSGIIMIHEDESDIITIPDVPAGEGIPMSEEDKLYDIPPSDNFTYFIVKNITVEEGSTGRKSMEFEVQDSKGNEWEVVLSFYWGPADCSSSSGGGNLCVDIRQEEPTSLTQNNVNINATRSLDLTSWYLSAGIKQPNVLEVEKINDDILYVVFDIA